VTKSRIRALELLATVEGAWDGDPLVDRLDRREIDALADVVLAYAAEVAAQQPKNDGYVAAFYHLGKLLGINARAVSPSQVWVNEMLPKLMELTSSAAQQRAAGREEAAAFLDGEAGCYRYGQEAVKTQTDRLYRMGQKDACIFSAAAIRALPAATEEISGLGNDARDLAAKSSAEEISPAAAGEKVGNPNHSETIRAAGEG